MYYEAISQVLPGVKLYINTADGGNVDMLLPLEGFVQENAPAAGTSNTGANEGGNE